MEHLFLPEIIISPKELAIGSAWLGENLIVHNNQVSTSIDRRIHGDWDFSFGSWKISNKMSVYFGRNADDKLEWTHQEPLEPHNHRLTGPGGRDSTYFNFS